MIQKKQVVLLLGTILIGITLNHNGAAGLNAAESKEQIPQITSVDIKEIYAGRKLMINGENLDAKGVQFKIGKVPLSIVQHEKTFVVVTVPNRAKSGKVTLLYNKKRMVLEEKIVVHKAPEIKKIETCIESTDTFWVKGIHLDLAKEWYVGKSVADVMTKGKKKVKLSVKDLPLGRTYVRARLKDMTFKSPQKISIVQKPIVEAIGYWPNEEKKGIKGVVIGSGFTKETSLKLAGKKVDVLDIEKDGTELQFEFKKKVPKKKLPIIIANGSVKGAKFKLNGKAEGFLFTKKEIEKKLFSSPIELSQKQMLLEVGITAETAENLIKHYKRTQKTSAAKQAQAVGKMGLVHFDTLQRLRVLQGGLCATLKEGKAAALENEKNGKILEEVTGLLVHMGSDGLKKLWRHREKGFVEKHHKKLRIKEAAKTLNDVVEARYLPWRACHNKYYGKDKISASDLVRQDLEKPFWEAFTTLFDTLIRSATSRSDLEKKLNKVLKRVEKEQRRFWTNHFLSMYDKINRTNAT